MIEPVPFVFFGERTPSVRLYSIGPQHLDWLCVHCGKTGGLADGSRTARWLLAMEQLNLMQAIDADNWQAAVERFDRAGWELAKRRCRRSAIEHLQGHLRFEQICGEDR